LRRSVTPLLICIVILVLLGLGCLVIVKTLPAHPPAPMDQKGSERFWKTQFEGVLPKDWVVRTVSPRTTPLGWTRTSDSDGVEVECWNPKDNPQ
jgi:hypothetical protein